MERELPPYRRTFAHRNRSTIWLILAVGALLAIAIAAGADLLSKTRERWEARHQELQPTVQPEPAIDLQRAAQLADIRERREQAAEQVRTNEMKRDGYRCINGQLFRKLPNGWENLPGERCQ